MTRSTKSRREWLTTGQAAEICSVTADTVLKWIKAGRLPARRTQGGHHRIRRQDLEILRSPDGRLSDVRFCWEFRAARGDGGDCPDCPVFRSRALRCYEIRARNPEGELPPQCATTCDVCGYYRVVMGQAPNVLVLSPDPEQAEALRAGAFAAPFNLRIVSSEYSLGAAVEMFPPDFVVLDGGMGIERALELARNLRDDPRVQTVRIVLATEAQEGDILCHEQIFARIDRPFGIRTIADCIEVVRASSE